MRVLVIHPRLTVGGAERVITLMAKGLKSLNVDVDLCFSAIEKNAGGSVRHMLWSSPRIEFLNNSSLSEKNVLTAKIAEYFGDFIKLCLLLKRDLESYDLINPHNFPAYWSAAIVGAGRPIVWTCHDVLEPYGVLRDYYEDGSIKYFIGLLQKLDSFIVRRKISKIVTNSKKNVRAILSRYSLSSKLIYPPIDTELFSPKNVSDKIVSGDLLIVQVGSFVKLKNYLASIIALKIVKEKIPGSKLLLVGEGPWKKRLMVTAEKLGLTKDVKFIGFVNDVMLSEIYNSCDICVHPVLEQSFGLVPFEAISSGKPVLVSSKCGAAEIFEKYAPGMIVEPSPQKVAEKILEVYRNYEDVVHEVLEMRNMIVKILSPQMYAKKILKIFQETLEENVQK